MSVWEKMNTFYEENKKPPKMERKIMKLLRQHPKTSKDLKIDIKWHGLEDCTVTFSGDVSEGAATAATFLYMPTHYRVVILFEQ